MELLIWAVLLLIYSHMAGAEWARRTAILCMAGWWAGFVGWFVYRMVMG